VAVLVRKPKGKWVWMSMKSVPGMGGSIT
jgi:hypothetical protein